MKRIGTFLVVLLVVLYSGAAGAASKKRAKRKNLKPITHPVVLWSRTLSETNDPEQKKVAAFKLSQYSQPIYQDSVVSTLLSCLKDSDEQIRILCAKAMGRAGNQSKKAAIRSALLETFKSDPSLRETLIRTFTARSDDSKEVQTAMLDALNKSTDAHETLALLTYFYEYGEGVHPDSFVAVFNKSSNERIKRWAIKVLAEYGSGENTVVELLATCAESQDTPLALTCLSGLQNQSRKDSSRTWAALEKTVESSDPDMLIATIDVLNVLPERINSPMTKRLIEIISETDDGELVDKAVLALGVCGDQSQPLVDTLQRLLSDEKQQESTKVHAALVLGKQAGLFSDASREALNRCAKSSQSQSLRTACQLGYQDLVARNKNDSRLPASSNGSNKSKPKS
ncbi:MAG: HEAT repeat domain-containing protein [Pseudomonadota bacterium]